MNRAHVLIGWQLPVHVCQSFTRQIRVYQHENVGEKVGENRGKFYLSPTLCQRVCRLFLSRSQTPTWLCQHGFANFTLSCDDRLALSAMLSSGIFKASNRAGATPRMASCRDLFQIFWRPCLAFSHTWRSDTPPGSISTAWSFDAVQCINYHL